MAMHHDGVPSTRPSLCTAQHSILQQERLYLLRALANSERRQERLTSMLNKIETVLATTDQSPSEQTKRLQRSLKTTQSKLIRCERTGQALCTNLDAVVAQMQRLDDHQWRRAHDEYAQQTQHGLMTSLSRTAPTCHALISPSVAAPSLQTQMQPFYTNTPLPQAQPVGSYYQPTINTLYNPTRAEQTFISQVPATPILRPLQYSNPDAFQLRSRQDFFTPGNNLTSSDEEYYYSDEMISPTDTVSVYSLSPWTTAAPVAAVPTLPPTFPPAFAPPTTQVFDLVQGLGAIAISGPENTSQSPGLRVSGLGNLSPPIRSTGMQQLQVQGVNNSGPKARRKAGKRRSA